METQDSGKGHPGQKVTDEDQAAWMRLAAELWKGDPSVVAVAPFLLGGRFWEAHGWNFVDCSHLPTQPTGVPSGRPRVACI